MFVRVLKMPLNESHRNSRAEVFYKRGVLKNFTKFTVKHLRQIRFFRPAILLKKRLWHRYFSCEFCEIFKDTLFKRTPLVAASGVRGCHPEVFCEKDILNSFAKLTGKHLYESFVLNKVLQELF